MKISYFFARQGNFSKKKAAFTRLPYGRGGGQASYSNVTLCGKKFDYAWLTEDKKFECYTGTVEAQAISSTPHMSYRIISENRDVETTFGADIIQKFSETDGFVIGVNKNPKPNKSLKFGLATLDGDIRDLDGDIDKVKNDITAIFAKLAKLETKPQAESSSASPFVFIPLEDGTYAVTQAHNDAAYKITDLVIPSQYNGKDVTSIGVCRDYNDQCVFAGNNSLKSVLIPETVKHADDNSFIFCRNLESITINSKTIDTGYPYYSGGLFDGCIKVASITLGPKFEDFIEDRGNHYPYQPYTQIGNFFARFPNLSSITVGQGNKKYRADKDCLIDVASNTLLAGCSKSEIPADGSVTKIGANAFKSCTGLKSITIPDCITSIGANAFDTNYVGRGGMPGEQYTKDSQLTSITLGKGITSLDGFASREEYGSSSGRHVYYRFYHYPELATIKVSEGNPKFHSKDNCLIDTALNTLILGCSKIPDSVKIIGRYAFERREKLTEITIPDSVEKIEENAFYGCKGLSTVTLGNGLKSIGQGAFSRCEKLKEIIIPNNVRTIEWGAFEGCNGLTKIKLGKNLTSLAGFSFGSYPKLATIEVSEDNTKFSIKDNCLIEDTGSGSKLVFCCNNSHAIPAGVTIIGGNAFRGRKNLTEITIPDNVRTIESSAFSDCINLATISFEGTQDQWKNVTKDYGWAYGVKATVVKCKNNEEVPINN